MLALPILKSVVVRMLSLHLKIAQFMNKKDTEPKVELFCVLLLEEMADSESKIPFTEAGDCLDEVEFVFDDGQKLYVSQNFLYYVSPVFKAMFEHDFKEKETRNVNLKEKVYWDFLEFLLCLHPDVQKLVDSTNVLSVVYIAEEYQAKLIIRKCKDFMSEWLQSELESARTTSSDLEKLGRVRTCLRILSTAETLQYNAIVEEACKVIGNIGHAIIIGTLSESKEYERKQSQKGNIYEEPSNEDPLAEEPSNEDPLAEEHSNEDPLADCKTLFDKLPEQLKYKLMVARQELCDSIEMHRMKFSRKGHRLI
ncbi:uncharacterized protein LOC123558986 [Mercenaria mercenaria]|uniref:uncharacterized protein LOC123558986 n=1 Tax=Mercenaria mercenaria TaxID=6596 RepID=UPI00234E95CB|nr:uncharacterized protein LOC123558986 [Mercenaria mercenaria]